MEPPKIEPEFQRFYHQLLSPLSLLPRRVMAPEPQKRSPQVSTLQTLRLVKLKVEPLCSQVAKLLANTGLASWVPSEGRLRLTKVILDELKCGWREPPAEPSLSYENNQKLRERLEAYVLLSCEQLFLRYLHLLVTMSTTSRVFTESATLTRLAASLARDCTVFLTSPDVYRCLLADFQILLKAEQTHRSKDKRRPACPTGSFKLCPIPWPHSTGFAQVPCSSLNLNYLVQLSRPQEFSTEPELDPMKELKSIPRLKNRKPLRWLPTVGKEKIDFSSSQMVPIPGRSVTPTSRSSRPSSSPVFSRLQRSQSMPCLREGWKLADKLGLSSLPSPPLTPLVLAPGESKPELTEDIVAVDLKRMMKNMNLEWTHYSALDSALPPLLGVVTHHPAAMHHLEELQRMLKNFQEREASGQWDHLHLKSPPLYPQPLTTALKLKDKFVVQAAAVRLSDRNFSDSFHVEGASVLYNHLAGELDSKVIEEMDIDRLVGSSTKEVYEELMSRVSTDHFCFDQGPLVEPTADKDWSAFLSSAFLRHEKQFQIVNPNLTGLYQRVNVSQPNPERMPSPTPPQPRKIWGKRSNKASWLNWGKTVLSVDDYFKYLTNQETDFLHVIFQMFEEEVPVEVPLRIKESPIIQRPPPLLEDEEPDFVPGEWDWNTVLEHGIEDEKNQILNLQKRLERLWSVLEVPHRVRLDMAIKYSSKARLRQLPSLVRAWERALKPIQLREVLLGKLEWFEQQASDPNRFFQKSELGLSHLLQENQVRSYFHRKLNQMEGSLVSLLKEIELIFDEPVTFKGQRYLDKMKWDKVEMLYWLQQQRRVHYLSQDKKASQKSALFKRHNSQSLLVPGNTPNTL